MNSKAVVPDEAGGIEREIFYGCRFSSGFPGNAIPRGASNELLQMSMLATPYMVNYG